MKGLLVMLMLTAGIAPAFPQNFSSRTNTMLVDYTDPKSGLNSTLPKITWQTPLNETVFLKEGKITIELTVESKTPLDKAQLIIRDQETGETKGTMNIPITDEKKLSLAVNRNITLMDGIN